ncbi:LysR family transcriptional regulator [Chromobacterium sp. IIBBL 290-4]|uniref:LysR family transcriptional regulator n=1 Tax=Chromobacterium sp. IIBBL 290-4 TaxID=2953890 RepID=UPI0020B6F154|nr:LysR family transcriptional regulator [Chromobacterium sp. IIBBL 290-4]UTH76523.1 LysR family transcriptional regulator [Chromobacterium sp. IIBBL 290-4]
MNNFQAVVSFLQAAEAGSFSQAARRLGVTPAAVSKHVRQLEDELGVRLVHRNSRALALTASGEVYFQRMSRLAADIRQLEEEVKGRDEAMHGRLRLSLPNGIGRNVFLPALDEFSRDHPELKLELHFEDRAVDLVRDGFDAAIGERLSPDSSFIARPLLPLQRVVFASPAYLARAGRPETLADLQRHDCIRVINQNSGRLMPWEFQTDSGLSRLETDGRLVVNDPFAACEAALLGAGLVMIGTVQAHPYLATGRLIPLLTAFAPPPRPLYFYYAERRLLPPALVRLQRFLQARMSQGGPPVYGNYRWP